jgi:hypothetical protein
VSGGIIAREIHQDAPPSNKLFAPGYGEFLSRDGHDIEAMALAAPTDALGGGVPTELAVMSRGADRIWASPLSTPRQWTAAQHAAQRMLDAWLAFRSGDVPPRLVKPTQDALHNLVIRAASRDRSKTYSAAIGAGYASNDLQLRYRPVTKIDTVRFDLWVRRALLDSTDGSLGGVRSDVVTLEWIRDRIANSMDPVTLVSVDTSVAELGVAVGDGDLEAAAATARALEKVIRDLL